MKRIIATIIVLLPALWLNAQNNSIPSADLRDLNGTIISSTEIIETGTATLLVFWKSSSGKCCDNLDNLQEAWMETLREQGVKLVAICVDCNGSWSQVRPVVDGNGWEFDTYIDVNGDFMRALCVSEVPCSMLYDQYQNLLCRYNSGCTGSQEFICQNILKHINPAITAVDYKAENVTGK